MIEFHHNPNLELFIVLNELTYKMRIEIKITRNVTRDNLKSMEKLPSKGEIKRSNLFYLNL